MSVGVGGVQPKVREYIEAGVRRDFDEAMKAILEIDCKVTVQPPEKEIEDQRKLLESRLR